jgi:hypothetical protein
MPDTKNKNEQELGPAQARGQETVKAASKRMKLMPPGPETPQEMALYDRAVFTWIAPEYIQHPKGKTWYTVALAVVAIFVVGAVLTADYTMALAVIVLAAVYYYIHTHHPPKDIKIVVSKMGIKVGTMIFPYSSIQAFWMHYQPPHITTLNLRVKEHFISDVIIQLNQEDPAPLREFLCGQIREWEGKNERFSDVMLRLLKL